MRTGMDLKEASSRSVEQKLCNSTNTFIEHAFVFLKRMVNLVSIGKNFSPPAKLMMRMHE